MIRRLQKGKRLQIRAADWNRIADAVDGGRTQRGGDGGANISQTVCFVQNSSGEDIDRGDVLGIDGPIITLAENEAEFLQRPTFDGALPQEPDHVGKFVVALEPIADGEIGRCVVSGVTIARVAMRSALGSVVDSFADIQHDSTRLRSGSAGTVRLLAVEEVDSEDAWAIVQLGVNDAGFELAEIQTVGTTTLECKWLNGAGSPMGTAFTVNVYSYTDEDESLGQVTLNADPPESHPTFAAGQRIRVYRQPRDEWNGTSWIYGFWAVDRVDKWCPAA